MTWALVVLAIAAVGASGAAAAMALRLAGVKTERDKERLARDVAETALRDCAAKLSTTEDRAKEAAALAEAEIVKLEQEHIKHAVPGDALNGLRDMFGGGK